MSLLLFRAGGDEPRACPLSLVTRLEDLDASTFEMTQRGLVVQYRGKLMPLASAGGVIRRDGRQQVLVFSQGESVIGLAVDAILDIVEDTLEIQLADREPGVLGSAVIKSRSTEIVDVAHFLSKADPAWAKSAAQGDKKRPRLRALLADSHPFFRNMLAPMVKAAGYDVVIAENMEQVAGRLASGEVFDVVLADADHPDRTGALEEIVQKAGSASVIPLSSRDDGVSTVLGPAALKSDRHALLAALELASRRRGEAA